MTTGVLERPDVDLGQLDDDGPERLCELSDLSPVGWQDCDEAAEWVAYLYPDVGCVHTRAGSALLCERHQLEVVSGERLLTCMEPGCLLAMEVRSMERLR